MLTCGFVLFQFYDALDTDSNGVVDYVDFNALEDEDARVSIACLYIGCWMWP